MACDVCIRDTLGSNVRRLPQLNNLTQQDLGKLATISRSHVSRMERGQSNMEIEILDQLAGALGVETWQLLQPRDRPG